MAWFATFCIVDIPPEDLDDILEKAGELSKPDRYSLWLATENWASVGEGDTGTVPPVGTFTSPFLGRSKEQVYEELQAHADGVNLCPDFCLVLDARSLEDGTVAILHRTEDGEQEEGEEYGILEEIRAVRENVALTLMCFSINHISWDIERERRDENLRLDGKDYVWIEF